MGVNAPGRPTMITFFPAQYSATLIFSTSGNPCITSTDGTLDGAAKARVVDWELNVAPATACMPTRAARDSFLISCILLIDYEERKVQIEIDDEPTDQRRGTQASFLRWLCVSKSNRFVSENQNSD